MFAVVYNFIRLNEETCVVTLCAMFYGSLKNGATNEEMIYSSTRPVLRSGVSIPEGPYAPPNSRLWDSKRFVEMQPA